tara:strand:+ start:1286 stop:1849 length:564 start_codon:yes stop_codon:yes gene_type:complete
MLDRIKALSAPPGHSLTGPPGKWAWEQPPRFTNPNQAIDFIINKLETNTGQEDMLKLMTAGITIQELVNQMSFKGFMKGTFNPDVAELIKPAMAMYLLKLGVENGITPQLFIDDEGEKPKVSDQTFFSIMKERNPALFSMMREDVNRQVRLEEQAAINESRMMAEMPAENIEDEGGFLRPIEEEETI